jgi:hypothetical protein
MRSDVRFFLTIACLLAVTVAATGAILSSTYGDAHTGLLFCALGVVGMVVDLMVRR